MDTIANNSAPHVDVEALAAEVAGFLAQLSAGEEIGLKLNRLLFGFLESEVLPQASRAAGQGLDPTPLFATVTLVLRRYADALQGPDAAPD